MEARHYYHLAKFNGANIIVKKADENLKSIHVYNLLVEQTTYNWSNYDSFPEYLLHSYKNYNDHISILKGYVRDRIIEANNQNISIELHAKIFEVVMSYIQGKPHNAYTLMGKVFDLIKDILVRKNEKFKSTYHFKAKTIFKGRIQRDENNPPNLRKDIFHIPFEKRHLVSGQRFSIHGVPSIYLGESIYDCYLELGQPDLDKFWVSMFYLPLERYSLMDLTFGDDHTLSLLMHQVIKDDEKYFSVLDELVDDFLLWPLIMACSIVCRFPEGHFRQEYIIPQILLHLCNDNVGFNGVRYYSTKLDGLDEKDKKTLRRSMINYALPAQDVKFSGFCPQLTRQLKLTEPITVKNIPQSIQIESRYGLTSSGLPIISDKCEKLKNDGTVLALDKMTMHFNQLIHESLKNKEILAKNFAGPEI